jgi:hypothetical protein
MKGQATERAHRSEAEVSFSSHVVDLGDALDEPPVPVGAPDQAVEVPAGRDDLRRTGVARL